jgi:hypothetical protein
MMHCVNQSTRACLGELMVHSIVKSEESRVEGVFEWLPSIFTLSFRRPGRPLDSEMAINDCFAACSISLFSRKTQ